MTLQGNYNICHSIGSNRQAHRQIRPLPEVPISIAGGFHHALAFSKIGQRMRRRHFFSPGA
ncbi:MAG: hypothetical protein KME26_00505 [Oscillatoria princeps RMCB-10]|nr:hypothetical protein [Oscillatoria princeps RMCB-10]